MKLKTLFLLLALFAALPCHALYKVVGPDGKVTYTDRVPSTNDGKVTPLNATGNVVAETALPIELRQPVARYPVTLYVIANCAPCDSARTLLRQRGVPHTEKLVSTEEDAEVLQRLTGARDAPTLVIGTQSLRGLSTENWNAYLDAAGYPRESRLPANYQFPAATPVTEHSDAAKAAARPIAPRPAAEAEGTAPTAAPPSGFKF